jgi:hypothetical protein
VGPDSVAHKQKAKKDVGDLLKEVYQAHLQVANGLTLNSLVFSFIFITPTLCVCVCVCVRACVRACVYCNCATFY